MNTTTLYHEEYTPQPEHRGRLLTITVSLLCYGSLLAALLASAHLLS